VSHFPRDPWSGVVGPSRRGGYERHISGVAPSARDALNPLEDAMAAGSSCARAHAGGDRAGTGAGAAQLAGWRQL